MCGIVGYVGEKQVLPIIIEGIKRLEYRGYDSSGFSVINDKKELLIHKNQGKIVELERSIPEDKNFVATIGIAHTRWATHGKATTTNAHPHFGQNEIISLVHNGIIENYQQLREKLEKENHIFQSDTDTEVLAHLIEKFYLETGNFHKAVREALCLVEGTYGIAVMCKDEPEKLIAAKRGSPLIVGIGENENFIASDVAALVVHTKNVIYLQEDETIEITKNNFTIKTLSNTEREREIRKIDWDISAVDKGDFDYYMLKEIFEQPTSISNAFRGRIIESSNTARLGGIRISSEKLMKIKQIFIIACGTSWHAGIVGEYLIEDLAKIPVEVEYASEFRYRNSVIPPNSLVIVISQSGETADTLAALREAKSKGAKVMGITNVVGSSIARETDFGSYTHAGLEIGVASTKAFTSQVIVLFLFAFYLGRMRNISPENGAKFIKELYQIPKRVQTILDMNDEIKEIAKKYKDVENCLYLGRDYNFPVALEGALKLKEISYIHAEGYPAAEMKHGPIALIDENMPVIFIAPKDFVYTKIINSIEEVKARKGRVIVITNNGKDGIEKLADDIIYIPQTIPQLMPILSVIPLQLFAFHIAVLRGCDVDQPRNLAKSVTVE